MVRELMHDPLFLARKSEPATREDLAAAQDLLDTLLAHKATCVGMAANMIGVTKQIIAFLVCWTILLIIWLTIGLPIGINTPLFYPA
jgi:peptide deformylase